MSPGDNGIPVIDGTYAENRRAIEESDEVPHASGLHRLNENRSNVPRFHHDWSDRSGSSRKFPKKYDSQTDDSSAVTSHRHRHRHQQEPASSPPHLMQPQQVPLTDASPMPATIDFSNLYANPHFEQVFSSFPNLFTAAELDIFRFPRITRSHSLRRMPDASMNKTHGNQ